MRPYVDEGHRGVRFAPGISACHSGLCDVRILAHRVAPDLRDGPVCDLCRPLLGTLLRHDREDRERTLRAARRGLGWVGPL